MNTPPQDLYVVSFHDRKTSQHWMEFFWAEDLGHAVEQAENSQPEMKVMAAAMVPPIYVTRENLP